MSEALPSGELSDVGVVSSVASELNNLMQIISGTSNLIENIWEGNAGSEKYFAMLRASIERAEQVTAQLVAQAGGTDGKVLLHPDLQELASTITAARPTPYQPTLMIVDDEQMALTLLQRLLTGSGYHVVCAQSGFECLDLFRRAPNAYDLVLLDLTMPFMDGQETFERLRRMSGVIDVVLTTGFVERGRLEAMLASGLSGFLQKPFGPAQINKVIQPILERIRDARLNCSGDGIAAAV